MDHILANQDKPVPDAASVSASVPVAGAAGGGGDVDEDEDMKAAIALSQDGAEAKVRGKGEGAAIDVGGGTDRLVGEGSRLSVPSVARFSGIPRLRSFSASLHKTLTKSIPLIYV